MKVKNPILRGFHPDPSIIRVGDDYYIATSTFEWWPGIRISHSRDLVNWETLTYVLQEEELLDLKGVGASQGIWAPCLTYDKGTYYVVFTIVRSFYCNMYDTQNFLVTAEDIRGLWSRPVALNNFGFDPSLFHDDDGKKYMVSVVTDHRIPKKYAGRIILQEYDADQKKMTGPAKEIYAGDRIFLEGPHILKRNGWYYLFSADTGTGEIHGQTIQRARDIWGPYEMFRSDFMHRTSDSEAYSILTTRHHPDHPIQKTGHASLVETQSGEVYAVHLCGRPLEKRNPSDRARFPGVRRYTLGRETAIQKMRWTEDDWLVLDNGTNLPDAELEICGPAPCAFAAKPERDDFDSAVLDVEYQSLRVPMTEYHMSLTERPGWLRLYGREGLSSKFHQSLIARRWTEFAFTAGTCMEFEPEVFKQMAGLICMYDTDNYLYLHCSHDEELGKCVSILRAENKQYSYPAGYIPVECGKRLYFRVEIDHDRLQFYYAVGTDAEYTKIGEVFDCSYLSDEACDEGWFTGAMTGLCCQDLTGFGKYADFDHFEYSVRRTSNHSQQRLLREEVLSITPENA